MKPLFAFAVIILSLFTFGCKDGDEPGTTTVQTPIISYAVVGTLPHDTASYTEGLEFYKGQLLESTGNYGFSKLIKRDPATGKIADQVVLQNKYFGEGISVLNDTLYQMTWKEKVVFLYDAATFKKIKELPLQTEGWGMTNDGHSLIVSDGSSNLFYYASGTFTLEKTLPITENGVPAVNINELEMINGFIYANQWQYHYILKIDPATGQVVAKMDLTDLVNKMKAKEPYSEVLNGIAFDSTSGKIYVTGKHWPEMLEIQFEH